MKILVLTNGGYFARLILEKALRNSQHEFVGVVSVSGDYYGNTGLKSLWKVGRQTLWIYVLYKVFVHFYFKLLGMLQKRRMLDVEALVRTYADVPIMHSPRVNTDEVATFVADLQPDIILSISCPQKISDRLLEMPSTAAINIHSSLLPQYAGLAPYFWVLAEGQETTGTTVHYMASAFDKGDVIVQRDLVVPPRCSAFRLFALLAAVGGEAVDQALTRIQNGAAGTKQDFSKSSYRSHPTLRPYIMLRRQGHCLIRIKDIIDAGRSVAPFS